MRGGLLEVFVGVGAASLLGACSTIIGLNDYDIDPSLDGESNGAGAPSEGGSPGHPNGGAPDEPGGAGGTTSAGSSMGGKAGSATGGSATGGTSSAGDTGAGGEAGGASGPTVCKSSLDCDDTIDCTDDSCGATGKCVHTPVNASCDGTQCEVCTIGIGCVAGPKTETQLLLDPSFDAMTTDWDQNSARFGKNIFADPLAQSGGMIAKFGPAALNAAKQEYADLYQYVTIPANAAAVTLEGYYKLTPGKKKPADDYVAVGLWDPASSGVTPFAQFHAFDATDGAQAAWKAFKYELTAKQVKSVQNNEYTFDLVANVWDSVYEFDTLKLNVAVCK